MILSRVSRNSPETALKKKKDQALGLWDFPSCFHLVEVSQVTETSEIRSYRHSKVVFWLCNLQ